LRGEGGNSGGASRHAPNPRGQVSIWHGEIPRPSGSPDRAPDAAISRKECHVPAADDTLVRQRFQSCRKSPIRPERGEIRAAVYLEKFLGHRSAIFELSVIFGANMTISLGDHSVSKRMSVGRKQLGAKAVRGTGSILPRSALHL
jgi:hypothetical protein